jgi:hypothetical protein
MLFYGMLKLMQNQNYKGNKVSKTLEREEDQIDLDSIVDEAIAEVQETSYKNDGCPHEDRLKSIIDKSGYETPNIDCKLMIIEILKTLNDQNRERFNYHEKTTKTLNRIEEKQSIIDKKYTGKAMSIMIISTALVSIVLWENKEMILGFLEPIWNVLEPFLKITKGE